MLRCRCLLFDVSNFSFWTCTLSAVLSLQPHQLCNFCSDKPPSFGTPACIYWHCHVAVIHHDGTETEVFSQVFRWVSENLFTLQVTNCEMQFAIYLPLECDRYPLPVLYFLSGLGLDHVDFIEKSAAQRAAAQQSVILVAPDSSPRNTNIPNENGQWNFGTKASYYINATRPPWSNHYKMFSYVTEELPKIIDDNFPTLAGERGVMGFSVGGHGAFLSAFKKPYFYRSLSALAPVCDIVKAPHSGLALESYLGPKFESNWEEWSAINLASHYDGPPLHILIDQGSADKYLKAHLFTQEFMEACEKSGIEIDYNLRDGFGHNYYFIKSFIEDHITYHSRILHHLPLKSSTF